MKSISHLLLVLSVLLPLSAQPPQSNHAALRAVPAPGAVEIDGTLGLEEWDRSAEILVYNVRNLRDRYSVRVSAMWDSQYLYLALDWKDPTPMFNKVNPFTDPTLGWQADSLQGRLNTDKGQMHLTAWYSSEHNATCAELLYGSPNHAWSPKKVFTDKGAKVTGEAGFAMAFIKNPDNRGYVQELRLPWALIQNDLSLVKAGYEMGFSGEYFWGGPTGAKWPKVNYSDPINLDNPVRVLLYDNPMNWGRLRLLAEGNLPPEDKGELDERAQGPLPLTFTLPAEASRFSLVVEDVNGVRVRNLINNEPVADYITGSVEGQPQLTVNWDGRANGPWNKDLRRFIGDIVSEGTYTVRALWHSGVGVAHEGSFYNPGTPPWPTGDGTGAWGGDHAPFRRISVKPESASGETHLVLAGNTAAETGSPFIGLDAAGHKRWEKTEQGRAAADAVAIGNGAVYSAQDKLMRSDPATGAYIQFEGGAWDIPLPGKALDMAADLTHVAVATPGLLQIFAQGNGTETARHAIPGLQRVFFAPNGRIAGVAEGQGFIVHEGKVHFFTIPGVKNLGDAASLPDGRVAVVDQDAGNLALLSTWGPDVKVQGRVGESGGYGVGPWNPLRMKPEALAADRDGDGAIRIWVQEGAYPRRLSLWSPDGTFIRDYLGGTGYKGTGGHMSDTVPTLGFVDGLKFRVNFEQDTYELLELMGDPRTPPQGAHALFHVTDTDPFVNGYHFISDCSGKEQEYYLMAAGRPRIFIRKEGRWQAASALINKRMLGNWPADLPPPPVGPAVMLWSDRNDDGFTSAEEVRWKSVPTDNTLVGGWGFRSDANLNWYFDGVGFEPASFTPGGAPVYDPDTVIQLPGPAGQVRGEMYRTKNGWVSKQNVPGLFNTDLVGHDHQGREVWRYPNRWYGVHGGMTSPLGVHGLISGNVKITGVVDMGDWDYISLRGNYGQEFLLRSDGLYLGTLFTDSRMIPDSLPPEENIYGIPVNDISMGEECFSGWTQRQSDGEVRITTGYTDVYVARVTGLDRVQEIEPFQISISGADRQAAANFVPGSAVAERVTEVAIVPGGMEQAQAQLKDSPLFIRNANDEIARVGLSWNAEGLHTVWEVFDTTPWENRGTDPTIAFKTGDGVALFVAGEGDPTGRRLVSAPVRGGVTMLYQPKAGPGPAFTFVSPVRSLPFQTARGLDLKPVVQKQEGTYQLQLSIPWAELGLKGAEGETFALDLGVILGRDDTTTHVLARPQWVDPQTHVVNDLPTEAEFSPSRWGKAVLKK